MNTPRPNETPNNLETAEKFAHLRELLAIEEHEQRWSKLQESFIAWFPKEYMTPVNGAQTDTANEIAALLGGEQKEKPASDQDEIDLMMDYVKEHLASMPAKYLVLPQGIRLKLTGRDEAALTEGEYALMLLTKAVVIDLFDESAFKREDLEKLVAWTELMENLEIFTLIGGVIGEKGAKVIAEIEEFKNLKELTLARNGIPNQGIEYLANSPHLAGLTKLSVGENSVRPFGAQYIAESPYLANLEELEVDGGSIGTQGVEHLANSPNFKKLKQLGLSFSGLTSLDVRLIAQSPNFPSLELINLIRNQVGEDGLLALVDSENLPELNRVLMLGNDRVSDETVAYCAEKGVTVRR